MNEFGYLQSAFTDVERTALENYTREQEQLNHVAYLQVGAGDKSFKLDDEGFWVGARKFVDAPFSVDPDGNVIANSMTLTGYVQVGGSGADVNSGATSINSNRMSVSQLSALTADLGTITAGNITGVTIQGSTFRTASSGSRIELTASSAVMKFYDSGGDEVLRIDDNGTDSLIKAYDGRHLALSSDSGRVYINSTLDMNNHDIWSCNQVRFINRSSDASSNNTTFVKNGQMRFRDNGGSLHDLY